MSGGRWHAASIRPKRMKALRRIFRIYYGPLDRRLRKVAARLQPARSLLIIEAVIVCAALAVVLTGSRAESLDRFGGRADILALLVAAALLALLHTYVNHAVLARLSRRLPLRAYDERRILFDLGRAARGVTNTGQIYELVVREIADALHSTNVSIFVSDDVAGDYVCRVSSKELRREPGAANEARAGHAFPASALIVKRLRGLTAPLGLTPSDLDTWQRAAVTLPDAVRRKEREHECATLDAIDARLLLGITIRERLVGILSLGLRKGARAYSAEDKRMLMSVASQLAFIIENAKLTERMVAEEGLRRELALAREVQQRLLPECAPQSESFELAAFCEPARAVGGDYYDFLTPAADQLGIAVADVAGKGISAALLMSNVQASLRSQTMNYRVSDDNHSLSELVGTMNRLIHRSTGTASYVTFFYAQFDERARSLTYVNAGHNPPLLVKAKNCCRSRADTRPQIVQGGRASRKPEPRGMIANRAYGNCAGVGLLEAKTAEMGFAEDFNSRPDSFEVRELTAGGPVLGVFEDCYYQQETVQMERGDLLFAFTDGLTESLDCEGREFGEDRLREALTSCAHMSADEVRDEVVRRMREWSARTAQHDDLTFVVMRVK
jgi:serine phosphatase RsbU (regulator of sigma subunit)